LIFFKKNSIFIINAFLFTQAKATASFIYTYLSIVILN